jgi:RHS repeat-associated protein
MKILSTARKGLGMLHVHADHLNTPVKVSRSTDNKLRWRWDNDPFGISVPSQNPQALGNFLYNLRYPGQVYDSETGLNYNYFRDYDPQVGRYVQSDPVGLMGGVNAYGYVTGNPLVYADPLGLFGVADMPLFPQGVVDVAVGIADSLSYGLGRRARDALGLGREVNQCSRAYKIGEYSSLLIGAGRVVYAGTAKLLPALIGRGESELAWALEISAGRNVLKRLTRAGAFPNSRMPSAADVLDRYGANPSEIIRAATSTNPAVNAVGIDAAAGGAANAVSDCGCKN